MFFYNEIIRYTFPKAVTALMALLSPKATEKTTEAPEDFTPAVRFALCSDIHLKGKQGEFSQRQLINVIKGSYAVADKSEKHSCLDAFIICGDMTDRGKEQEYKQLTATLKENLRPETRLLCCMGNHEFIEGNENKNINAFDNYSRYINNSPDTHYIIKGYHFIGLSYSDGKETFGEKTKWLKEEIEKAVSDTPDKPVFVFQHPHPFLTVYGSVHWGNLPLRRVLCRYPQVVDFSGHSHYNSADPRSIWQGSFTAVGTGSLTGLVGNMDYLDGNAPSLEDSGCYHIAEADEKGNILLRVFDSTVNKQHKAAAVYLAKGETPCSFKARMKKDTPPLFPENSFITAKTDNKGNIHITFPEAKGYYPAQSYKVKLYNEKGRKLFSKTFISGYIRQGDGVADISLGKLTEGRYKIHVKAVSPYYKISKALKKKIEIKN